MQLFQIPFLFCVDNIQYPIVHIFHIVINQLIVVLIVEFIVEFIVQFINKLCAIRFDCYEIRQFVL